MHRQQLDRSHAERLDVADDVLVREAGEGAALALGHAGMELGEAAHMGLVDDGAIPGHRLPHLLALPVEVRVDNDRFRHEGRAVALVERAVLFAHLVAEDRGIPLQLADVRARVRVEQQLVRIEAMAFVGLVGTMHAKTVNGARTNVGHVAVPDLVAVFRQLDARGLRLPLGIEEAQLHLGRVRREQREVDPFAVPGRPLGIWQAFLYRGELQFGRVHVAETMTRKRRAVKCAERTTGFSGSCPPAPGWWRGCTCAGPRPPRAAGSCAARRARRGARGPGAQRAGCG